MAKRFPLVLMVLLAACSSGPPKHAGPRAEEWHPPAEMLDKYADTSGSVTRRAMEAGLRADFDKADINHDGCLNDAEVGAINQERWKENASTASPLIDFKHAGCIDFEEFAATPRSLFDQLDRKGNGVLTREQLHPGQKNAASPEHHGQ
jgi:Ca2+-binding EF-hand superfamily protein